MPTSPVASRRSPNSGDAAPGRGSRTRLAPRRLLAALGMAGACGLARPPAAEAAVFVEPVVTGTAPSGVAWKAVASGTVLPVRTSGSLNGFPGAVAYWDTTTGLLQLDPKGWGISLFNFTYTTGTTNVSAGSPGPLTYATGTVPVSALVSGTAGLANQRTLPAGAWSYIESTRARISGAVSPANLPVLATSYEPGNGAGSGSVPYATDPAGRACVPGWFNQPWAFPADMIASGSVAIMSVANWRAIGGTPSPTANALGYGAYRSVFQYTISGVTGTQVGAVIPVPEPSTIASSMAGLAIGCWQLVRRRIRPGRHGGRIGLTVRPPAPR